MPLVRIDLAQGHPAGNERRDIGQVIYEAMRATLDVPDGDRFQIMTAHPGADLVIDSDYLGVARSKHCIVIQVTLNAGRSVEQKRAFYRAVADGLNARLRVRREDVFINLVEVKREDWSFGNGEAQYAT